MTLFGWCMHCRKVKRVRVRVPPMQGQVAVGVCDDCAEKGKR